MLRSISLITLVVASFQAEIAHAELDSLLGDWASDPTTAVQAEDAALPPQVLAEPSKVNEPVSQTLTSHEAASIMESPPIVSNPYVVKTDSDCQPSGNVPCECNHGSGGCNGCQGCDLVDRHHFQGLSECRPHHAPVLPSSTFLQYFRSRNSYTDIWAGYCDETRQRPRNRSQYLHGAPVCGCDGCGELIEPGCHCNACGH